MSEKKIAIIGGGLAGCECAYALAERGLACVVFEMRPESNTAAHETPNLAELVCSNSFRSNDPQSAVGLLKKEMRTLGSLTMQVAEECSVPAGKALAVDRSIFSQRITEIIEEHPLISLRREKINGISSEEDARLSGFDAIVVAAGPLASEEIANSLRRATGEESGKEYLYFYDAIAPIVYGDSLNMDVIFRASRYSEEEGDYLNCPMNKEEYLAFREALLSAEKVATREFEQEKHFEGCMPIEALAERGEKTLCFGPLKPVGFIDPRTGRRPFAVVQLRAENLNQSMYNLVGCQTKLTYGEQERIFRTIPGMEKAEFARLGSMHRNTYVNAPLVLSSELELKGASKLYLAGQITGVEGYVESAASGLWLGMNLASQLAKGVSLPKPPLTTCLGALLGHLTVAVKRFQPSNVQYGLMPELEEKTRKSSRKEQYSARAEVAFSEWLAELALL